MANAKSKRDNEQRTRTLAVAVLIVAVVALGVAFAALSTVLNINGTAQIKSASWDVRWTAINCTPAHEAALDTTSTTAGSTGFKIDTKSGGSTDDTAYVAALFKANGDSVTCKLTAKNQGTIPAKIDTGGVTSDLTALTPINVSSTLYYSGGTTVPAAGDALAVGATKDFDLTLTYTGQLVTTDSAAAAFEYHIPYTQSQ
ncbi:MAG: hypothetical protein LBM73_01560 [Candidatus Nomurabacteria bacterium]|nr:hypothetical protein [Candidatus Nomurabacteria bacterium]